MNCWFCGGNMSWESDADFEDYGINGDRIVASLTCSECGATAEFYTKREEEQDEEERQKGSRNNDRGRT